ncbi:MAG TPA: D-alanyl-lipoteichoic acid biosynthesis protein DltD [Nitrosopumilaceae archaeon]|nr:D-alanyl-lipoteichoic acid biosynthesis protein DltD [Nitrosopumilaceae archaeon]
MNVTLSPNIKISLIILGAFVFALIVFYSVMEWYLINYEPFNRWVKTKLNSEQQQKQIFILGSSQVGTLNTTFINQRISSYNNNFVVYNLAISADKPSTRLNDLNKIISLKPNLVIYGVGYRDFEKISQENTSPIGFSTDEKSKSIFPDPRNLFGAQTSFFTDNEFVSKILNDPQLVTLTLYLYVTGAQGHYPDVNSNTPLIIHNQADNITSNEIIKKEFTQTPRIFNGIDPKEISAFDKIIDTLKRNNIQVAVFANPYNKLWVDKISNSDRQLFNSTLEDAHYKYGMDLYSLQDKYNELNIWTDAMHVAYNQNSIIYSEDVSKIILNEIGR